MTTARVVIVTHWFDPTADVVIERLNHRKVQLLRFDAADFPGRLAVTARLSNAGQWRTGLRLGDRAALLEDVAGVYFRRPTRFRYTDLDTADRQWAAAEARAGLGGLLMTSPRWLNHPHRLSYASYKAVQLALAPSCGLRVPLTLITNDPCEVRAFITEVGDVVYKPMARTQAGKGMMVYATPVTLAELEGEQAAAISATAHMFQEKVKHDHAVRLTVVDARMFAATIRAHSERAAIDWRADYGALTYERTDVPEDVRRGVLKMMSELGLRFGAFDFLASPDRGWVFLEVNPNGQWAWIEEETGMPIAEAIADALTEGLA